MSENQDDISPTAMVPEATVQDAADAQPEEDKKVIEVVASSSIFKYFLGAMMILGVCFVCSIFVFQVLLSSVDVWGISMQPTINASVVGVDHNKQTDVVFCYKTTDVKYKDIVIIDDSKMGENIIKRVIAEPGQTITFKRTSTVTNQPTQTKFRYDVYVDGELLQEDYINKEEEPTLTDQTLLAPYSFYNMLISGIKSSGSYSINLQQDEFFVMGDNRNHSTDSRYFGPVSRNEIMGKVVLQVKYGQTIFGAIWDLIF